jgi:hypothetical protein
MAPRLLALVLAMAGWSAAFAAPNAAPKCPVTEKTLAGAWANVAGGFFEEMEFAMVDGRREFNSWLHQRPEIAGGTWLLEACTIRIRHPTEAAMSFSFKVVRVQQGRIYLRDEDRRDAVYRRLKP